ncbi:Dcp1p-Dcp2p decapping enzyme complex alpha subunit [Lecanicillium sp. MT-2017a]|nr:Dcp1p-Dcp2p decapping enzyme complex alpha subunit [Lecanicillium sp. MT-2017a]
MYPEIVLADLGRRVNVYARTSQGCSGAELPPITLCRKNVAELENADYLVYEKTDGVRCLLYVSSRPDGQCLTNRKNEYYRLNQTLVDVPVSDRCTPRPRNHQGATLLNGELVRQQEQDSRHICVFVAFDCLVAMGKAVVGDPHFIRTAALRQFLIESVPVQAAGTCGCDFPSRPGKDKPQLRLEQKQSLPAQRISAMLTRVIPKLKHGNDGLVFVHRHERYIFGTDQTTFKWERPLDKTVDFLLEVNPSVEMPGPAEPHYSFHLQVRTGTGNYRRHAKLHLLLYELEMMSGLADTLKCKIIECYRDLGGPGGRRWKPAAFLGGAKATAKSTETTYIMAQMGDSSSAKRVDTM